MGRFYDQENKTWIVPKEQKQEILNIMNRFGINLIFN